jgi:hypothetical protein
MFAWWAGFLVLTIAGERLELSRMRGPSEQTLKAFGVPLGLFIAGLVATSYAPGTGIRICGAGLVALTLWLYRYDVARRTVKIAGLPRFMAINLFVGYGWLAISGILWLAFADTVNVLYYDAMLHSLFLGFVFSMIFAHAPVIFPAVLGRPLDFTRAFYAHVIVIHLALLLRIGGDLIGSFAAYQWGGMLSVVALLVFVANTAICAVRSTLAGSVAATAAAS